MNITIPRIRCFCLVLLAASALSTTARADWTAVRDLVRAGDHITDEKKQEETLRKAYALAQQSVSANPNVSNEYLWLANSAGRLAQIAPTKEKLTLSKVVKDGAEKAIALDPKNGSAYMTLGAWHYYMSDLGWFAKTAAKALYGGLPPASFKDAAANLTKAASYGGVENMVEVYYLLGRSEQELDDTAAANAAFQRCIAAKARNEREQKLQQEAKSRIDD